MADAIRQKQSIRGVIAVAERPNGKRVSFLPFPTPIFRGGDLIGAVNTFIDITEDRQITDLRSQAVCSRRLTLCSYDKELQQILFALGDEYEAKANLMADARERADYSH